MSGFRLCTKLLAEFGKGNLAGSQVHDIAVAAREDGWAPGDPLADRLVSAGSFGEHRNHLVRDIVRAAEEHGMVCSKASPYEVTLSTGGVALVYLPHEAIPAMIKDTDISRWVLPPGDTGPLAAQLQQWGQNPDVAFEGDLGAVPILGMHCDGVQYTASIRAGGGRSVIVGSFNVISAQNAADLHKRHPFFLLRKRRLLGVKKQHARFDWTRLPM
jgi:hypothetical protein